MTNQLLAAGVAVCFLGSSALAQIGLRGQPIRTATLAGLVLLPAGFGFVLAALVTESTVLFVLGALVGGLGQGLAYLGGQSLVERVAPPEQRSEIFSLYMIVLYVSGSTAAITFGLVAKWIGLDPAAILYASFVVLLASATLLVTIRSGLLRTHGGRPRTAEPSAASSSSGL